MAVVKRGLDIRQVVQQVVLHRRKGLMRVAVVDTLSALVLLADVRAVRVGGRASVATWRHDGRGLRLLNGVASQQGQSRSLARQSV